MTVITRQEYWSAGDKPTEAQWNEDLDAIFTLFDAGISKQYVRLSGAGGISALDEAQTIAARKTYTAGIIVDEILSIAASGAGMVNLTDIRWDPASGTLADNDGFYVRLNADNDAATPEEIVYARWGIKLTDVSDGTEDAEFLIGVIGAGTLADQIKVVDGALAPVTDNDVSLGSASLMFKNGFFKGVYSAPLRLGAGRLWYDATNQVFRTKHGSDPSSEIDGYIIQEG